MGVATRSWFGEEEAESVCLKIMHAVCSAWDFFIRHILLEMETLFFSMKNKKKSIHQNQKMV
jgi:hypothetical protein